MTRRTVLTEGRALAASACEGNFLPSSDDPVAVRMVSDKSMKLVAADEDVVGGRVSSQLDVVSLVVVFAGAALTTVVSVASFVAVYVYVEAAVCKHTLRTHPGHMRASSRPGPARPVSYTVLFLVTRVCKFITGRGPSVRPDVFMPSWLLLCPLPTFSLRYGTRPID